MNDSNEQQQNQTPVFPEYQKPSGTPIADSKQSGVLAKRISKMLPKMRAPKGIQSKLQTVHVSHKKKSHPNPVTYY